VIVDIGYHRLFTIILVFSLCASLSFSHKQQSQHLKRPLLTPSMASSHHSASEFDEDEVGSLPAIQPRFESALDVDDVRNAMAGERQLSVVYLDETDEITMHPPTADLSSQLSRRRKSEGDIIFKCWMYKRSRFYSRIRVMTSQKWQLRLFVLDGYGLRYSRSDDFTSHATVKCVNIFEAMEVEIESEENFILSVKCVSQTFKFRCLNREDFFGMYESLKRVVTALNKLTPEARRAKELVSLRALQDTGIVLREEEGEHNLMTVPSTPMGRLMHYLVWPLKAAIFHTIPSVSDSGKTPVRYNVICLMCTLWLLVLSFLMNYCMETIGQVVGLSSGVMGLTFGAAGTSFPNLLSSMLVAKLGQGNMAVSNAFGSNVFCVFMGLGFPWTLYVLMHGHAYEGLKDDGIVLSVMTLIAVLLLFLILIFATRFVLYRWMGYLFLVLYGAFLVYSIAQSVS
jgi:Ca2+/Na+ antiporter